ncbi:MAG: ABC transporter substrate-binding protein [Methanocella sp.]
MTIFVGIDDTDNLESRGTGRLARGIAAELGKSYQVYGVTRHQLLVHPDIPYTSHNSSAVIHLRGCGDEETGRIFRKVKKLMLADFIEGSDPGLAVATSSQITAGVAAFGLDAKKMVVTMDRAKEVARNACMTVEGLGGTCGGIIGAVAGIGLASMGNDGRFLMKGRARDLKHSVRTLSEVLASGIDQVVTLDGRLISGGRIDLSRSANPSFVQGKAVLFVEESDGCLIALKRD